MQSPEIPENESERLGSLEKLNLLDTAIEERYERITRLATKLLDAPISAISLVDEDRQWFKSIQGINAAETSRSVSFCAHAILRDETLVVEDASNDARFSENPLVTDNPNIRFYAGQPIKSPEGQNIGALCVIDSKPRTITEEQLEDLKDLAAMVEDEFKKREIALAQVMMSEELEKAKRAVLLDPLTKLWNRQGGEEFLKRQHAMAVRKNEKFCLAMVDIDLFKNVNDAHGHAIGDEVLRQTAKRILSNIGQKDFVCRIGGEEFLLMIADPLATEALQTAQKVRRSIRDTPFEVDGLSINVTISIGLAYFDPASSVDCEQVIKLADDSLYSAKRTGRDKIISHIENSA
jgi:diguanylate cyclase (GGDEF)-like protein